MSGRGEVAVPEVFSPGFFARPYDTYDRLRAEAPVHRVRQPDGVEVWLVTRWTDARAALNDPRIRNDLRHAGPALRRAGIELDADRINISNQHMLHSDPPQHTRLRGLVNRAFTPARVERLRPRIQEITDELLDAVDGAGEVDLIEALAYPLPVLVICEVLGVPAEDIETFRGWSNAILTPDYVPDVPLTRTEGTRLLRDYLAGLVMRRRSASGPGGGSGGESGGGSGGAGSDIIGALVEARDEHGRLSEEELVAMVFLLFLAGHESSINFLGSAMLAVLERPEQWRRLRDDPDLLPRAVDECLRYDGPIQRATLRTAVEDVTIGGVAIPAGSIISVCLGAANRDPDRFDDAGNLDVSRTDNPHLAFGNAQHFCLGATLARIEGQVVLGSLLRRFPRAALACAPDELRWRPTFQRGLQRLPVRLGGAAVP